MTVLLYLYLAGWIGTSTAAVVECEQPKRLITKGECRTIAVIAGAVWPAVVIEHVRERQ